MEESRNLTLKTMLQICNDHDNVGSIKYPSTVELYLQLKHSMFTCNSLMAANKHRIEFHNIQTQLRTTKP